MRLAALPLASLLVVATALAIAPTSSAAPLPAAVRQSIVELSSLCRDSTGVPGKSPGLLTVVDLNGDGIADYVIDAGAFNCEGAASAMTNGQAGANVSIFVGGADNTAAKAYSSSVYGNRLDRTGPRPRLFVDVAAQLCGQRGAANLPFARWEFCSRPLNWDGARRAFVLAPLAEKRPVPQN